IEQIVNIETRPPRQIKDDIPKELERICLKALSKRASERYTTAKDLAEDLRHFLAHASDAERNTIHAKAASGTPPASTAAGAPSGAVIPAAAPPAAISYAGSIILTATSEQRVIKVVPKGLRSFDAHDADFFLELLPGPRDRDGLPDTIRFWKTRIEEM